MTAHRSFRAAPVRTRRSQRGASFAELMLAVLIISTTVVASHSSLTGTISAYHYFADGEHESLLLAKEIHEAASLLPWEPDAASTASFGAADTLYELDEQVFAPPRSAGYDVVTSHLGWSQTVDVKTVSMEDPSIEVDPDTFVGPKLTELSVTVKDGEKVIGTHSWWLAAPTSE